MTHTTLTSIAMAVLLAGAVSAQSSADANGDGVLTIDEVQAVMPEITPEDFSLMDTNADGTLDGSEIDAAQEAGLMPA